ncbi:7957_t:CDS:2, partial [Entrophospora sp. SA101]
MLNSNNSSTTSLHQQFEELSLTSTTTTKESSLSYSYSPPSSPSFLENFGLPPTFQLDIEVPDFVLRPTKTYSERRREKLLSNRGYIKPRQELEKESREKGLAKRIDEEDNIESPGLKILKKWGYRKGMALGESSKNEGITEPLGIELKQDRLGLGMSTELKQKAKVEYERKSKKIKVDEVTFRERIRQEHLDKRIRAQLKALQKICETLDTRK